MSDKVFERTTEEAANLRVKTVDLTPVVGDPLVDSKLLKRVRMLREKGIEEVKFSTNGIAINKIGAKNLISSGLTCIHISTCGFDADEFELIYRSNSYDDVVSGIENLLKANTECGCPCDISISVISRYSRKKVLRQQDAVKLLKLGAKIYFTPGIDNWNGTVPGEDLPRGLRSQVRRLKPRKGPCRCFYSGPVIYPDGDASACNCRDIECSPQMYLGNIMEHNLDLMHKKTIDIIRRWNSGCVPKACKACKVYSEPRLGILPIVRRYRTLRGRDAIKSTVAAARI
jgi:MoaA/NifB/PqqE/SkfB family radical SAM enzyme